MFVNFIELGASELLEIALYKKRNIIIIIIIIIVIIINIIISAKITKFCHKSNVKQLCFSKQLNACSI